MKYLFLWHPNWTTAEATPDISEKDWQSLTPRLVVEPAGGIWVDSWGLDAREIARGLARRLPATDRKGLRACAADVPVVAEVVVRHHGAAFVSVPISRAAETIAPFPIDALRPSRTLRERLDGVGISRIGEFAALDASAVETRFGRAGVNLLRLAKGIDTRSPLPPFQPGLPAAEEDVTHEPLFSTSSVHHSAVALLAPGLAELGARGLAVRSVALTLTCENGDVETIRLIPPRPSRDLDLFSRILRERLERTTLADRVTAVFVQIESVHEVEARQSDLFDTGSQQREIVEELLRRVVSSHGTVLVTPLATGSPQPELRTQWNVTSPETVLTGDPHVANLGLALRLLPNPEPVEVRFDSGDTPSAIAINGRAWTALTYVSSPQMLSGSRWRGEFSRTYWRCLASTGELLWVFRDVDNSCFLHGRWD